jgi:hypothetical protein
MIQSAWRKRLDQLNMNNNKKRPPVSPNFLDPGFQTALCSFIEEDPCFAETQRNDNNIFYIILIILISSSVKKHSRRQPVRHKYEADTFRLLP